MMCEDRRLLAGTPGERGDTGTRSRHGAQGAVCTGAKKRRATEIAGAGGLSPGGSGNNVPFKQAHLCSMLGFLWPNRALVSCSNILRVSGQQGGAGAGCLQVRGPLTACLEKGAGHGGTALHGSLWHLLRDPWLRPCVGHISVKKISFNLP